MILVWLLASYLRMRDALRWWYQRQAIRLHTEAEQIRNGLLQEAFSLRRGLELALVDDREIPPRSSQDWLTKLDRLHHTLEQLSNHLSPPYLEESLPLAVQYILTFWQTLNSHIAWHLELPSDWQHEPPERSRVILTTLDEFLKITLCEPASVSSLAIGLTQQDDVSELRIEVTFSDMTALTKSKKSEELGYLCHAFQCLTPGKSWNQKQGLTVKWYFRW